MITYTSSINRNQPIKPRHGRNYTANEYFFKADINRPLTDKEIKDFKELHPDCEFIGEGIFYRNEKVNV